MLACKPFLARILKDCAPEYKDSKPEDIERLIGITKVGLVAVEEDETAPTFNVAGMEDISLTEGKIVFDIYCIAQLPNSDKKTGLIINVESQKTAHTGYPLVSRAIYYTARMLSSQPGVLGIGTDYGSLWKVYSIWICTEPPISKQNSIEEYKIERTTVYANQSTTKNQLSEHEKNNNKPYDLQHVVFVNLGACDEEGCPAILKLLNTIMSPQKNLDDKKEICTQYNIPMTREIEEEITDMSCVLDRVREEERIIGVRLGKNQEKEERNNELLSAFVQDKMPILNMAKYLKMSVESVQTMIRERFPDYKMN